MGDQRYPFPEQGLSAEEKAFLKTIQRRAHPPLIPDWPRRAGASSSAWKTIEDVLKEVRHV
jgi:hypothetical protein